MEMIGRVTESAGRHTSPHRDRMLQTRDVCAFFNISDRTLDRWCADEKMEFPAPTIIRRRKYWSEASVLDWRRERAKRETATEKAAAP